MMRRLVMIAVMMPLLFLSCGEDGTGGGDDYDGISGKIGDTVDGRVTFYEGYDSSSVAYYAPEIESGWYKCAVSENKLREFPPQSAAEITYDGKTIRVLVTDLCPNSENSHWTSQSDYYFDLGKNAFAALEDTVKGHINVSITKIAYQTSKNIRFQEKPSNGNGYYIAGRFYNMRYPLAKVEVSSDGKNYTQMKRMAKENNWWELQYSSGGLDSRSFYFRLTDVYDHTITSSTAMTFSAASSSNGIGTNFPY